MPNDTNNEERVKSSSSPYTLPPEASNSCGSKPQGIGHIHSYSIVLNQVTVWFLKALGQKKTLVSFCVFSSIKT